MPGEITGISFWVCLDNMSTGLQHLRRPSQKQHAHLVDKVVRELQVTDDGLNKELGLEQKITLCWIPSNLLPADIKSKSLSNLDYTSLWLQGPPLFQDEAQLRDHSFTWFFKSTVTKNTDFQMNPQSAPKHPLSLKLDSQVLFTKELEEKCITFNELHTFRNVGQILKFTKHN